MIDALIYALAQYTTAVWTHHLPADWHLRSVPFSTFIGFHFLASGQGAGLNEEFIVRNV